MTFFDCTADLVGQLNGNGQSGQKGMLQIEAPPVEKFLATPLVMAIIIIIMSCANGCDQLNRSRCRLGWGVTRLGLRQHVLYYVGAGSLQRKEQFEGSCDCRP